MTTWERVKGWLLGTPPEPYDQEAEPESAVADAVPVASTAVDAVAIGPELVGGDADADTTAADEPATVEPHGLIVALVSGQVRVGHVESIEPRKNWDWTFVFVEKDTGLRHPVRDLDALMQTAHPWKGDE